MNTSDSSPRPARPISVTVLAWIVIVPALLPAFEWGRSLLAANLPLINFEATGNPRIDPSTGHVLGTAWSAGTGWISFDTPQTDLKIITQDTDGDTIPDIWELLYVPNLTTLAANKDTDGDGRKDADEYAAGTDPTDRTDFLQIVNLSNPPGAFGTLRWTSKGNRNYRVQSSTDLLNWQFLTPNAIFGQDGPQTSASVPKTSPRIYFRVIALKPPAGE